MNIQETRVAYVRFKWLSPGRVAQHLWEVAQHKLVFLTSTKAIPINKLVTAACY